MATRTLEQLDAIRNLRLEIASTRDRVLDDRLPQNADRRLDQERLSALTQKLMELEAPPPVAPPAPIVDPSISREEALARADAIRARPEFFNPHRRNADGVLFISPEDHARLQRELSELGAIAYAPEGK